MAFIDTLKQKAKQLAGVITAPQQRLTKDILRFTSSFRGAEEAHQRLEEVKQRIQEVRPELLEQPEFSTSQADSTYQELEKTLPKRSPREVLADVGETALTLYTPAKVAQATKAAPFLKRLLIRAAEGGVGGGAFGGLEAIREKQPLSETAKTVGEYAAGGAITAPLLGAGFDLVGNAFKKGMQALKIRSFLNKARSVYEGKSPAEVVAQLSDDVAKKTNLPKDIVVKQSFFEKMAKDHPEISPNRLFNFVKTLNIPDEIYQLPQKEKLNFFRKLEDEAVNLVSTGKDWDLPQLNVITSFEINPLGKGREKYILKIKKTGEPVYLKDSGGTPQVPSSDISKISPGEVPGIGGRSFPGPQNLNRSIAQLSQKSKEGGINASREGMKGLRVQAQKELQIIPSARNVNSQMDEVQSPQTFLQSLRAKLRQHRADLPLEPLDQGMPKTEIPRPVSEELSQGFPKKVSSELLYHKAGMKTPLELNTYLRTKGWLGRFMTNFREQVVNDWERVRQIANDPNLPVQPNQLTPFERRKLYFGRVAARIEQMENEARDILADFANTSKELGVSEADLKNAVNEYLIAQHAPERNFALGNPRAAGISNDEAAAILQRIEALPYASRVRAIAAKIKGINERILDILYQEGRPEGVIDKETYDLLRKRYQNHVPLNRIFDESEDVAQILSGRGLDVRGAGIFKAKGSERQIADITENVFANYAQAIQRVEKNIVDNETLRFARQFNQVYPELKLFEEIKPKAIGKTFSGEGFVFERLNDPTILALRESGKQVWLKINDPRLAVALKGVNREKLPSYIKWVHSVTRFLAGLATRFNPEFFLPNKIRDLQEAVIYTASQKGIGGKGALSVLKRDPQSLADIVAWLRGVDSPGARLYEQMRLDGGTTGGLALSTRKQLIKTLEEIEEQMKAAAPKKIAQILIQGIDKWNQIFEDSTRLSVYKSALKRGFSRERAALLAKEASIDFNQFGTKGPIINALYMFSNASIQGSYKMLRALRNPKVAATVTTAVGASVFAVNEWNDRIDPEWRDKVSEWDRVNSLTVVLPSINEKFNYISIPVSWGLKPIKVAMDYGYDLAAGYMDDIGKAFEGILTALIEGYNPLGEQNLMGAITPTILDVPMQIYGNRAWWGGHIRPEGIPYTPTSELYFKSLEDSLLGRGLIKATGRAYEMTGGRIDLSPADINYAIQQYIGGAGRFTSKVINTISLIGQGEAPPAREIPFVSRFLRTKDIEETGVGAKKSGDIKGALEIQARARMRLQKEAEREWERLKKIESDDEYNRAWNEIVTKDRNLAKKIKDIVEEERLGLTYEDKLVKQLGVENGERAHYLYSYLMSLPEDRYNETWQDLVRKKVITREVANQIKVLMVAGQKGK